MVSNQFGIFNGFSDKARPLSLGQAIWLEFDFNLIQISKLSKKSSLNFVSDLESILEALGADRFKFQDAKRLASEFQSLARIQGPNFGVFRSK